MLTKTTPPCLLDTIPVSLLALLDFIVFLLDLNKEINMTNLLTLLEAQDHEIQQLIERYEGDNSPHWTDTFQTPNGHKFEIIGEPSDFAIRTAKTVR